MPGSYLLHITTPPSLFVAEVRLFSQRPNVFGAGKASLVKNSKGIFRISIFFSLDKDNLTARDPWNWHWREEYPNTGTGGKSPYS